MQHPIEKTTLLIILFINMVRKWDNDMTLVFFVY